jgi:hypothetical protein
MVPDGDEGTLRLERVTGYDGGKNAVKKTGVYSPALIAWRSWKRVSSSLASEITKRTRPWAEVSA